MESKHSQPAFTGSKLTTETREQGVIFQVTDKDKQRRYWRRSGVFIWTYFTPCFSVSIDKFRYVIAVWVGLKQFEQTTKILMGVELFVTTDYSTNTIIVSTHPL